MIKTLFTFVFTVMLVGCVSSNNGTLYQQLNGKQGIEKLVESFINQIGHDEQILAYFKQSNVAHFRQGFITHLCSVTDGPCEYKGDNMVDIHTGMNISKKDFNRVVELLINAMDEQQIPQTVQNKILSRLAPLRPEIIDI
ncbi:MULTISPECIES: group 1 truncated hemoglobin [unclassified Pseudoalteromonas]|uniref:group I truncated hemoglobin n=1 Tax=unclassified Pseudoalteromonas TaxID=194690 RepID=UPI000C6A3C7F|nr:MULTISPECIES: group 1 truncated hemoglobin [unclassified Pseudoalteromonas]MAH27751.1 group 1 truncated hemoglobin [Pseudoalteromonadaceae bacterium]MCF2916000.1 group 1 truncated hemoglobin [Pseudoalteromonas sp. Cn5-37]TMP46964.1 group 1 truncated hemoglobin [Pseudoalteromonas sp. S1650]TMP69920.1 group 1 truncated hemoglobin [Pseudoalteromonas sp. S1649]|tara:strand:- start:238 stop:657 length:420 start_codon:yes stop_codon:yes gene_type:complete